MNEFVGKKWMPLRVVSQWDQSPIVSANFFLSAPESEDISEALRELAPIAAAEVY